MQIKSVVDPFGEVNVYDEPDGSKRVVATLLMEPYREGSQTGIAIDGSASMKKAFGVTSMVSPLFKAAAVNYVTTVAQQMCAYLAENVDADGGTTAIAAATGGGDTGSEPVDRGPIGVC